MAETLGSLCDKLTIVKLKQYHCSDVQKKESLERQELLLKEELDLFVAAALNGSVPKERLTFFSNKVYKKEGNEQTPIPDTSVSAAFAELAKANCDLWHEQEKVYVFEDVPPEQKNHVIKQLALLNLRRTECVDIIDKLFAEMVIGRLEER